ncbi:lytic transglycosylase domain-containing protein [Sphingomonas sp. HHU CXW]|uniref:Lytic transglycosylase domain-containing protein n=1 Tax=Sphingomonas hominis TaxID=2741495 RepID=A0ABX2JIL3_9SPHN|nr:lytic transglycosylase domain-containing protein [Sphingomonas hominis]NTS66396.1 lytic transglycosylase domain-containing protein [Sphingomonas hominis]
MTLPAAVIMGLAAQCAPSVAPATIAAIVQTESRGFELAIGVNGIARQPAPATSVAQAVQTARHYVSKGYSVDLGLGQINSRNMKALGLTWDNVFDPCTNIAAAGAVLSGNYHSVRAGLHPQRALRIALSMYNTGSQSRGFRNGYVGKVVGNAGFADGIQPVTVRVSAFTGTTDTSEGASAAAQLAALVEENTSVAEQPKAAPPPPPPSWDVFARAEYERDRLAEGENR